MDLTGLIVVCSCGRDAPQNLQQWLGLHSGNAEDVTRPSVVCTLPSCS